jgi:hypothetical protein
VPAAAIRIASGLAATSFSTWPVTEVSVRLYFSSPTILMPAVAAERRISASQPSP